MNDLIKVNKQGEQVVSGRLLYDFLQIKTKYNDWFKHMCEYGFERNIDYVLVTQKKVTNNPKNPVTKYTDHILTLDMAKELCMIQRSDIGRQARKYFIEVEKAYKKQSAIREAGKIARRGLTDVIRDEIPDSSHKKYVYGNFTDLIYKHVIGCSARQFRKKHGLDKKANIREYLSTEQIKAVDKYESLIKDLIRMGWEYEQIKNFLQCQLALTA